MKRENPAPCEGGLRFVVCVSTITNILLNISKYCDMAAAVDNWGFE